MALATEWVARIIAISLLMFLPGVGGKWLDDRLNTNIFTLVGFGFGLCAGLAILLVMVRNPPDGPDEMNAGTDDTLQDESEDLKDYGSGER